MSIASDYVNERAQERSDKAATFRAQSLNVGSRERRLDVAKVAGQYELLAAELRAVAFALERLEGTTETAGTLSLAK